MSSRGTQPTESDQYSDSEQKTSVLKREDAENRERRRVQKDSSSRALFCNLTDYASKRHCIEKGEMVMVETYEDGIFIRTLNPGGDP